MSNITVIENLISILLIFFSLHILNNTFKILYFFWPLRVDWFF